MQKTVILVIKNSSKQNLEQKTHFLNITLSITEYRTFIFLLFNEHNQLNQINIYFIEKIIFKLSLQRLP